MTKLCTFYATKIQINDHEIDLNHDTELKLGSLKNLLLNENSSSDSSLLSTHNPQ